MPRPRHCSSPRYTGRSGLPSAKHEIRSVPPAIDASCTSSLTCSYTKSKLAMLSGEPVDRIARSSGRAWCARGSKPDFSSALRYFALPLDEPPENAGVWVERRAVVEHERGAGCERGDEPVPHHPTASREIEHDV